MTSTCEPILYSSQSETIPSDEGEDIQRAVVALRKLLKQTHDASGTFHRGVHMKSHGCATASFQVLPNLPAELSQGLFARAATHESIVRFSNAAFFAQADALPDARGCAVKVLGVDGEVLDQDAETHVAETSAAQDFVMVNHPVFFAANVKEFARLEEALVEGKESGFQVLKAAIAGNESNPLHWHWREVMAVAQTASHWPLHPARTTYFSMSPIRFGAHIAKYRILPAGEVSAPLLATLGQLAGQRDAFKMMLRETLSQQSLLFEFQVQLQTSAEKMPIEDASREWPESESLYRTVALVILPRQQLDNPDEQAARERMSFNAWHCLTDHQPLGGINRLRREAYPVSVRWRR